jgi:hypothetical protein
MKSSRVVSTIIAHVLAAGAVVTFAAFVGCGGSQNSGVTSQQGATSSKMEGDCLRRGAVCAASFDCCTEWCANGYCAMKQP